MEEMQLTMAEKMDAQDAPEDDQFVKVTSEPTALQWQKIRSSNSEDDERLPHDMGRMMR